MDSSFFRIHEREVSNYLGLKMDEGFNYTSPQEANRNYAYIQLPVSAMMNTSEETLVEKGLRNQYIQIIPACKFTVMGNFRFEVHPNPALNKFGIVQAPYYLEPGDSGTPSFHLWLRKDLELSDIDWAVRIYMRK